jgi:hypothetical protein
MNMRKLTYEKGILGEQCGNAKMVILTKTKLNGGKNFIIKILVILLRFNRRLHQIIHNK